MESPCPGIAVPSAPFSGLAVPHFATARDWPAINTSAENWLCRVPIKSFVLTSGGERGIMRTAIINEYTRVPGNFNIFSLAVSYWERLRNVEGQGERIVDEIINLSLFCNVGRRIRELHCFQSKGVQGGRDHSLNSF